MKLIKILSLLVLPAALIYLSGCYPYWVEEKGPGYEYSVTYRRANFDGDSIISMEPNSTLNGGNCRLNILIRKTKDGKSSYYLGLNFSGYEIHCSGSEPSLSINFDNSELDFVSANCNSYVSAGGGIKLYSSFAEYVVSEEVLKKIAQSSYAKISIKIDNSYKQTESYYFTREILADYRHFYSKYINK